MGRGWRTGDRGPAGVRPSAASGPWSAARARRSGLTPALRLSLLPLSAQVDLHPRARMFWCPEHERPERSQELVHRIIQRRGDQRPCGLRRDVAENHTNEERNRGAVESHATVTEKTNLDPPGEEIIAPEDIGCRCAAHDI